MSGIHRNSENDLSHSMAHYLLTVHKLKEQKGYARVTDIAKDLGLTKGSVSTAINNLKKRSLIVEEDESKFLSLSAQGHNIVHHILSSRTLLFYFLRDFIGVEEGDAKRDSCLMEHLIGQQTREKLFTFMKDLSCACEEKDISILGKFNTSLNLCDYKDAGDFIESQEGDSYLQDKV
ncbi:MAG: metal-dependent transcriptional regulator [Bacteriovoracaceae bacterium]|jgi:DtxR family transcriptional regulator, Mn-dependent transcriptional regulator|nr:metal-dependent transcriptional regulator [Bacteriovoracaceae bacterium]